MTAAARPIRAPTKGGTRIFGLSRKYSSRDLSAHTTLKSRDRRKGNHLLLEGSRRDTGDRSVPRSVDADDSDVESKVMIRGVTGSHLLN